MQYQEKKRARTMLARKLPEGVVVAAFEGRYSYEEIKKAVNDLRAAKRRHNGYCNGISRFKLGLAPRAHAEAVPRSIEEERDRRIAAFGARAPAAALLGDPPLAFSALAQPTRRVPARYVTIVPQRRTDATIIRNIKFQRALNKVTAQQTS